MNLVARKAEYNENGSFYSKEYMDKIEEQYKDMKVYTIEKDGKQYDENGNYTGMIATMKSTPVYDKNGNIKSYRCKIEYEKDPNFVGEYKN